MGKSPPINLSGFENLTGLSSRIVLIIVISKYFFLELFQKSYWENLHQ